MTLRTPTPKPPPSAMPTGPDVAKKQKNPQLPLSVAHIVFTALPESDCGALGKLKETGKKNNQINGREQDQKQQQRLAWRKKDCKGMKKVEEGRKNGA